MLRFLLTATLLVATAGLVNAGPVCNCVNNHQNARHERRAERHSHYTHVEANYTTASPNYTISAPNYGSAGGCACGQNCPCAQNAQAVSQVRVETLPMPSQPAACAPALPDRLVYNKQVYLFDARSRTYFLCPSCGK